MRLKFLWPAAVRISKLAGLEVGHRQVENHVVRFHEFVVDWEKRIFPGETVELVGPRSDYKLEYELDEATRFLVATEVIEVKYSVHFEDHPSITGTVPFIELAGRRPT